MFGIASLKVIADQLRKPCINNYSAKVYLFIYLLIYYVPNGTIIQMLKKASVPA